MVLDEDITFHLKRIFGAKSPEFKKIYYPTVKEFSKTLDKFKDYASEDDKFHLKLEDGKIIEPEGNREICEVIGDEGLGCIGMTSGEDSMPKVLGSAWYEMLSGTHSGALLYDMLTSDVIEVLNKFEVKGMEKKDLESTLDDLTSGKLFGGMVMTESGAGSDVGRISTQCTELTEGKYAGLVSLEGEKIFISNPHSDYHIVLARDADFDAPDKGTTKGMSMVLVKKDHDGKENFTVTNLEEKMGQHMAPTGTIAFKDSIGYLVGEKGKGMFQFFNLMNFARMGVASQALGLMQAAYSSALGYAKERIQGNGKSIIEHADVSGTFVKAKSAIEATRGLIYESAMKLDQEKETPEGKAGHFSEVSKTMVCLSKMIAPELGEMVTADAVQMYGGYGYTNEFDVERYDRDMKICNIYEGTREIQSLAIMMSVKKGGFDSKLDEMADYLSSRDDDTSKYLEGRLSNFRESLSVLKTKEGYANLEPAKELAKIYSATLLLQHSEHSERKKDVADAFVSYWMKSPIERIIDGDASDLEFAEKIVHKVK